MKIGNKAFLRKLAKKERKGFYFFTYIRCCGIVLMCYNVKYMSRKSKKSGGFCIVASVVFHNSCGNNK